jgi:hypothetical protein
VRSEAITGAEQASEPLAEERPEASVIPRTNNPKIDTLQRCAAARPLTPMSGVGVAVGYVSRVAAPERAGRSRAPDRQAESRPPTWLSDDGARRAEGVPARRMGARCVLRQGLRMILTQSSSFLLKIS